jgi:hypothetical protein
MLTQLFSVCARTQASESEKDDLRYGDDANEDEESTDQAMRH